MRFLRRHLKKLALAVPLLLVAVVAHAILPAFLTTWLITGSNLMIADGIMGFSGALAGWLIFECETGRATSVQGCKDYRASSNPDSAPIAVRLKPDATRKNPDPTKFDNPVSPARDAKPKASMAVGAAKPGNGSLASIAAVGVGRATYANTDGSLLEVDVIQTYQQGLSQAHADSAAKTNTSAAHTGWNWSSGYYISSTDFRAVWYRNIAATCPTGYTLSGTTCTLTNASAVKKPAGTQCEILYYSSSKTFQFDAANPSCDGLASQMVSSGSPGKMSTTSTAPDGSKEGWSFEPYGDGWKICQDKGANSTMQCLYTGAYAPGQGGYPIEGSTSGPGGGLTGGGTGTGGTGTGTGTGGTGTGGTGTGGTGTGGTGDCAGYGCAKESTQQQVLTGVQDITKAADATAVQAAQSQFKTDADAAAQALLSETQTKFKTASDYSGITSGITSSLGFPPGGQCSNAIFNLSLFGRPMTVDFQWLCGPIAPIVNWFFWMLITLAAISEILYILTGRGLPGEVGSVVAGHKTD